MEKSVVIVQFRSVEILRLMWMSKKKCWNYASCTWIYSSPLFVCSLKMQLNATFQVTFIVGISFIFITRREHNLWHNEERELLARDALQVCGIKLLFSSTSSETLERQRHENRIETKNFFMLHFVLSLLLLVDCSCCKMSAWSMNNN